MEWRLIDETVGFQGWHTGLNQYVFDTQARLWNNSEVLKESVCYILDFWKEQEHAFEQYIEKLIIQYEKEWNETVEKIVCWGDRGEEQMGTTFYGIKGARQITRRFSKNQDVKNIRILRCKDGNLKIRFIFKGTEFNGYFYFLNNENLTDWRKNGDGPIEDYAAKHCCRVKAPLLPEICSVSNNFTENAEFSAIGQYW